MKQKEISFYLDMADRCAEMSTAVRLKVGAVMVNGIYIAYGYNGTVKGWDNVCEEEVEGQLVTHDGVIHAEENVLLKCAKAGVPCEGGVIFLSHSPCFRCVTRLIQAGISKVIYRRDYRCSDGVDALIKSGISVIKESQDAALLYRGYENK